MKSKKSSFLSSDYIDPFKYEGKTYQTIEQCFLAHSCSAVGLEVVRSHPNLKRLRTVYENQLDKNQAEPDLLAIMKARFTRDERVMKLVISCDLPEFDMIPDYEELMRKIRDNIDTSRFAQLDLF